MYQRFFFYFGNLKAGNNDIFRNSEITISPDTYNYFKHLEFTFFENDLKNENKRQPSKKVQIQSVLWFFKGTRGKIF